MSPDSKSKSKKSAASAAPLRKHRYKPRKLIPTDDDDDEDDDSESTSHNCTQQQQQASRDQRVPPTTVNATEIPLLGGNGGIDSSASTVPIAASQAPTTATTTTATIKSTDRKCNFIISENQVNSSNRSSKDCLNKDGGIGEQKIPTCCAAADPQTPTHDFNKKSTNECSPKNVPSNCPAQPENLYESISNYKCCQPPKVQNNVRIVENRDDLGVSGCRECAIPYQLAEIHIPGKSSVRKLMRKSRSKKQKNQNGQQRVRSLSVGNENFLRNGSGKPEAGEECLNNLRRNDLIDIIRESMEKNRLCFQTNG